MKGSTALSGDLAKVAADWLNAAYEQQTRNNQSPSILAPLEATDWLNSAYVRQLDGKFAADLSPSKSKCFTLPRDKKRGHRHWSEERMFSALAEARTPGQPRSLQDIADSHGIPRTTFRTYFNEGRTTIPPLGNRPTVTPAGEGLLMDWLRDRCLQAAPVSKELASEKLRAIVQEKRKELGLKQREFQTLSGLPGKNVWKRLRLRNPELRVRIPSRHSAATLRAILKEETYTAFFNRIRGPVSAVPVRRRYTMDEAAFSGNKNRSKVLYITGTGRCQALEADGYTAHVSLVNCVRGDGVALKTALIFGGREESLKLEPLNDQTVSLGYVPSGFNNQRSLLLWLTFFRDETRPTAQDPVVLIVDQHSTRFSLAIRDFCRTNHIILVLLPPNMTSKLSPLDVSMHRGLRAEMRKRIGMDLSQFVRLKRERVADYVAAAHVAAFTPGPDGTVVAGWRKTCLDTLDPTPLLHELKTRAAEVKTATERRAAERERLQRLLSEAKDPQRVEELKEAVVEAAAIEAHCDMPELPEPSRRRDKRTMPEGGVLTSPEEEKRQLEYDRKAAAKGRGGKGRKRRAPSGKKKAGAKRGKQKRRKTAASSEAKTESKRAAAAPAGRRRPLRSRSMVSEDESDFGSNSAMVDDVLESKQADSTESFAADGSAAAVDETHSSSARETKSEASNAAAAESQPDDEPSLSEKEDTEVSDVESNIASDREPSEVDFPQSGESKQDDSDDLVLGECMDCLEPVFLSECGRQCPDCGAVMHSWCGGSLDVSTRTRAQSFKCPACKKH